MVGGDKRGKNATAASGPEKPSSYNFKTITGMLVGQPIDRGLLPSVTTAVLDYFGETLGCR